MQLLYFTIYHFQTNDFFERANQTAEIALRFHLFIMKNSGDWLKMLLKMQRHLNNSLSMITFKTLNEVSYEFTSLQSHDL